jgi:hypothetical protein
VNQPAETLDTLEKNEIETNNATIIDKKYFI